MRRLLLGVLVLCVAVLGCVESPLARDNPLDLGSGATLSFTTVDTAFSHYENILFTPSISLGYIPEGTPIIDYRAQGPNRFWFTRTGPGGFGVTPLATVEPVTITVEASLLDRLFASTTVVVMQRLRQVTFTCGAATCGTVAQDASRTLTIVLADSLGFPLNIPGNPDAHAVAQARDTTIAQTTGSVPGSVQLTGKLPGMTWLVVGNAHYLDSLPVVVTPP